MEITNDFAKLSTEVIKYLGIRNTYFSLSEGITSLIKPLYIAPHKWEVLSASPLPSSGTLNIELDDGKFSVLCNVIKLDTNLNSYLLLFKEDLYSGFLEKLSTFNKISFSSDKRREERFNIGLENWKKFGLTKPEIHFVFNTKTYKSIINNVSVHGALLTGETAPLSQNESLINLICSFNDPNQNVFQNALVVNCQNLKNNYSRYSLQFLDPISFVWQKRILDFSENI